MCLGSPHVTYHGELLDWFIVLVFSLFLPSPVPSTLYGSPIRFSYHQVRHTYGLVYSVTSPPVYPPIPLPFSIPSTPRPPFPLPVLRPHVGSRKNFPREARANFWSGKRNDQPTKKFCTRNGVDIVNGKDGWQRVGKRERISGGLVSWHGYGRSGKVVRITGMDGWLDGWSSISGRSSLYG